MSCAESIERATPVSTDASSWHTLHPCYIVPKDGRKVAPTRRIRPAIDRAEKAGPPRHRGYVAGDYRPVNGHRSVVARPWDGIIRLMGPPQVLTSSRYDSRVVPLTNASIIVPTYREAPNIEPLVTRIFEATTQAGIGVELIIVDDDSQDGTEQIVERLREQYPVRLVVRRGERGLSGAVLAGFREAKFDQFIVLDADLQHPPEMVPQLSARLNQGDCDFVIGTRYSRNGSVAADWPIVRRLGSAVATLLARPLARLSDPMSGFFAIHRRTWEQAAPLDPIGYKIALELFVKGRCRRPAEVPITFASRTAGASKASFAEGRRYLRHLARLYRFRFPRLTAALGITVIVIAALFILICVYRLSPHPDARSTESARLSTMYTEPTTHEP